MTPSSGGAPVALVTGATSGIGRATARLLASSGWRVVATARDASRLESLENECGAALWGRPADLMDTDALPALLDDVLAWSARTGERGLSALVHAAGVLIPGDTASTSPDDFARTMDLNVGASYALSHLCIPHLMEQAPRASIVHVSSVAGLRAFPGVVAYCVSKAALDQLTRCMALELAPHGVRVNAVNPGVVLTELHRRGGMDEAAYAAFLEHSTSTHPLGRVGTPEEIAGLIEFLLSERAGWITGETIAIDGGRHLTAAR